MRSCGAGFSPDQLATTENNRLSVLLVDDNTHFVDYVTAVGIAAGADIVGLSDSRWLSDHLARMHRQLRFKVAIVAMMNPGHDAAVILPHLATMGSIDYLIMLANLPSPSAMAMAERFALSIAPWKVESWEKPVHAGFLRSRLAALSGTARDNADVHTGMSH